MRVIRQVRGAHLPRLRSLGDDRTQGRVRERGAVVPAPRSPLHALTVRSGGQRPRSDPWRRVTCSGRSYDTSSRSRRGRRCIAGSIAPPSIAPCHSSTTTRLAMRHSPSRRCRAGRRSGRRSAATSSAPSRRIDAQEVALGVGSWRRRRRCRRSCVVTWRWYPGNGRERRSRYLTSPSSPPTYCAVVLDRVGVVRGTQQLLVAAIEAAGVAVDAVGDGLSVEQAAQRGDLRVRPAIRPSWRHHRAARTESAERCRRARISAR